MTQRRLGGLMSVVLIMFCVIPHFVIAQISPQQPQLTYTLKFSESDLIFDELMGYDVVQIKDGDVINDIGKPMMPAKEIKIALPAGMGVEEIQIAATKTIDIEGEYTIFPAQPPLRISETPENFVEPELETYNSTEPYPGALVKFIDMTDLAGQGIAVIHLYPVQYIPRDKKITLYTEISFVIKPAKGYECGDYLPSEKLRETYEQMVKDMVINPEDVELRVVDKPPQPFGVGPGDYDYVIITQTSWVDDFQPLANWKTKKGIPANIVTTDWIYNSGGYSGTQQDKIKAFVQDAHSNWGTIFFLLGGDTGYIPYYTDGFYLSGEQATLYLPSDTYYGDYDRDWTCEVHVGRASVTNTTAISTFINKIMTYEKNPPLTNYAKKAALFGFDLDGITDAEDCKIYIDNNYIPGDWTMSNEYDSEPGTHEADVKAYINAGQNLINHADHSGEYFMGTGYINHGYAGLSTGEVDAFYNGDKQSILYSMGCWACAYDYGNCIAEHFARDANGGGVAFIGNSRYGWYNPGNTNTLSMLYDKYFFRSLFIQNHYKLGDCFSDHKNDGPTSNNYEKYIFAELTLLGDPELPIWTENPTTIDNVDYADPINTGSQDFTVTVTDGGNPVNGALVCVQKGGEVYEYGTTLANGQVTFTINPTTTGNMDVTVTKRNLLPYEGTATVSESPPEYTLTIIIDGNGSVTKDPDLPTYPLDTDVILTADPDLGWSFDQWTGDLNSSENPDTITMDSDKTVTAHFTEDQYTLTINIVGYGSVTKNPDQATYTYGTDVILTAVEDTPGWVFNDWSGDLVSTDNPETITMDDDKTVTATFVTDGHVLDLNDFPMYLAASPCSLYSGAAAAQMALNYMWWDANDTVAPPMTYIQSDVYDTARAYSGADPLLDVNGVWKVLQILRPLPYTEYGYNFNKYSNTDSTVLLKLICEWLDYTIGTYGGHKDGHPYHVPGIIPAYGGYKNWMAVRGIHTDTIAYPMPDELTVYGFWMNDPCPDGIGENSYRTTDQFLDIYYDPLSTGGGQWDGKYVGILEPPEEVDGCVLHIPIPQPHFSPEQIGQLELIDDFIDIPVEIKGWIIQAAIDGVNEHLIPYDQGFKALFSRTKPGEPIYVQSYKGEDYFCVPFGSGVQSERIVIERATDKQVFDRIHKAMVVILIDAHDGSFKEASWTGTQVEYLPLLRDEARAIAFETTEELGIEVDINSLQPELIHRQSTPYYPEWRVLVAEYAIYISQDGAVSVEEWEFGPHGGPTSAGEGSSFTYSLNTGVPTPFVKSTVICYSIARPGNVLLSIYDVSGRLVKTLVQAEQNAGVYNLVWNGYDNNNQKVAPGVYFTKFASGDFISVKKLILIK